MIKNGSILFLKGKNAKRMALMIEGLPSLHVKYISIDLLKKKKYKKMLESLRAWC